MSEPTDVRPVAEQIAELREKIMKLETLIGTIMAAGGGGPDLGALHPGEASHLAFVERTKGRR